MNAWTDRCSERGEDDETYCGVCQTNVKVVGLFGVQRCVDAAYVGMQIGHFPDELKDNLT